MWGNQLSDNYNTTTEVVNERKKTNFMKRSEQCDYLNRIEMNNKYFITSVVKGSENFTKWNDISYLHISTLPHFQTSTLPHFQTSTLPNFHTTKLR